MGIQRLIKDEAFQLGRTRSVDTGSLKVIGIVTLLEVSGKKGALNWLELMRYADGNIPHTAFGDAYITVDDKPREKVLSGQSTFSGGLSYKADHFLSRYFGGTATQHGVDSKASHEPLLFNKYLKIELDITNVTGTDSDYVSLSAIYQLEIGQP